tara:strand:- start:46 stop:504 length:459 start_codon:yes stop_codon:yes gene_type:complete
MKDYKSLKTSKIELIKVTNSSSHINTLFDILKSRNPQSSISHTQLPSYKKHKQFVISKPYRYWFLILASNQVIGNTYVTRLNEISIKLKKNNSLYYQEILSLLINNLKPLKAIPSKRRSSFLINVSARDKSLINLFSKMGLKKIQETYKITS